MPRGIQTVNALVTKITRGKNTADFSTMTGGQILLINGGICIGYKDGRGVFRGYSVSAVDVVKAIDAAGTPHQSPVATASPPGEATETVGDR